MQTDSKKEEKLALEKTHSKFNKVKKSLDTTSLWERIHELLSEIRINSLLFNINE